MSAITDFKDAVEASLATVKADLKTLSDKIGAVDPGDVAALDAVKADAKALADFADGLLVPPAPVEPPTA